MRLKNIGFCLLLALALSACATINPYTSRTDVTLWKAYFDNLTLSSATDLERSMIKDEISPCELESAKKFYWVNPAQLTPLDRLFLLRYQTAGKKVGPGIEFRSFNKGASSPQRHYCFSKFNFDYLHSFNKKAILVLKVDQPVQTPSVLAPAKLGISVK